MRSFDKGKTWEDPIIPPTLDSEIYISATGEPLPTYNRGAMYEGKNGKIYWIVAGHDLAPLGKTSNHLLVSEDKVKPGSIPDWLLPMIVLHSMKLPFMKRRRET